MLLAGDYVNHTIMIINTVATFVNHQDKLQDKQGRKKKAREEVCGAIFRNKILQKTLFWQQVWASCVHIDPEIFAEFHKV